MRVLIVGCGYVGLSVGKQLVGQGHAVWGLRRSRQADAELKVSGIIPLKADITMPRSLHCLSGGYDWVVHSVSASGGATADYERTYLDGTRCLLGWLAAAPPSKLVYTSSTSVYGQTDGTTVDESSPTEPQAVTGQTLVQTEKLLLSRASEIGLQTVVLRVAAIYGPGRSYWLDQLGAGKAVLEDGDKRVLNMIHRDDVAGAVIAALMRGQPGGIYNVVDDEPVTLSDFYQWLATRLSRALPAQTPSPSRLPMKRGLTNKRVSNRKLKEELVCKLKFPTFRQGYDALLTHAKGDLRD